MLRLAIIVPCYNEEEILECSTAQLTDILNTLVSDNKVSENSFILFVNDGSHDRTWDIINEAHKSNRFVKGISLAHNRGHQYALLAGMEEACKMCDAAVTIDADLQDDPKCIFEMVDSYYEGYDVVYGVRSDRHSDSFLKRFTAESFYKFMNGMGVETIYNHADFRFMSKRVMDSLFRYKESNLYLRALIPMIGYRSKTVEYSRSKREAGETKYTLPKMINLAVDGITSFSEKPLRIILTIGISFVIISIAVLIYIIVSLLMNRAVPGWTSLMLSVWFVGGVILIALGIIGLYIGKIYRESKRRPKYDIMDYLLD